MADDTRLAEASLLLNYSAQSYKEQLLLTKKLQQTGDADVQGAIIKIEHDQLVVEKNVPSKLITPPPEHEYTSEVHEDSIYGTEERYASPTESEVNFTLQHCTETIANDPMAIQGDMMNNYYNNYYDISREPINNLLAAVNCALPVSRARPNILQRSTTNYHSPKLLSSCPPKIQDHDYCQQDQQGSSSYCTSTDGCTGGSIDQVDELANINAHDQISLESTDENPDGVRRNSMGSKRKQKHPNSSNTFNMSKKPLKLVAIHLGAGNSHNETESMQLAKKICEEIMSQTTCSIPASKRKRTKFTNHSMAPYDNNQSRHCECRLPPKDSELKMDADQAVVNLIQRMEDHQLLNCGYGSNLNMKGQVECDASFMSEKTQMWTGVGAISGCKNPILLAKSLHDHRTIPRPLGLIQPNLLVGSGAKIWMNEHCPHLSIIDSKMVSSRSLSTYQKLKSRYDAAVRSKNQNTSSESPNNLTYFPSPVESNIETSAKIEFSASQSRAQNLDESSSLVVVGHSNKTESDAHVLDHGFYCMTTRDNLRRVVSFAKAAPEYIAREQADKRPRHSVDGDDYDHHHVVDVDYNYGDDANPSTTAVHPDIEFQTITSDEAYRLDTVGAIAVDCDGNFASAISSGGLFLKYKGRVGQASVPGAGCWSEDNVAVTTTGVGEYLTVNMFARKFYDKMSVLRMLYDLGHVKKKPDLSDLISCGMEECFEDLIRSPALDHVLPHERLAGMLSVCTLNSKSSPNKRVDDEDLYLSYAHNTSSMCVGYMTCDDIVGHSVMSRGMVGGGEKMDGDGRPVVRTMKFSLGSNNGIEHTSMIT